MAPLMQIAYAREILLRQTAGRYAAAWHHREPFWYFFTNVIPQSWLPLVLVLPWLAPAWRRQLQKRDGRALVLLGWVALVVLFFCISSGQAQVVHLPRTPGPGAGGCATGAVAAATLVPSAPSLSKSIPALVATWFVLWFARGFVEPYQGRYQP